MTQPYYPPPGGQPMPPQQPYGAPQQPQYPQQQQAIPQQGPPNWPPQQPQQGGVPQQPMPPQQSGQAPPGFEVNEQAITDAYAQSQQQSAGFDGVSPTYFRWLGPQGETKWNIVPVGFERVNKVWACQPPVGHKEISFELPSHHIMYWEGGEEKHENIDCWDQATCGLCQGAQLAASNPQLEKSIKRVSARRQAYYQIIDLENPQIHFLDSKGQMRSDQLMRPLILACSPSLHNAIGKVVSGLGMVSKLVDPYSGRPLLISRKKSGTEARDVKYDAQYAPDQEALPEMFWPVLHNLWDLHEIRKKPTQEDWTKALVRLGWPIPGSPGQIQVPANFQQGPMPPGPNPYQQQQMPGMGMPGMPPMPMTPQMPGMPQQPPQQPPQQMPPQQMPPQQMPAQQMPAGPPPMGAPPQMPEGPPPPVGAMPGPQPMGPPPPMNPPPLQTSGATAPSPYAPQGQPAPQAGPPGPPPPTTGGVPFNPASGPQSVPSLTLDPQTGSLPAGTALKDGRERCFGKYVDGDMMCKECSHDIKTQCVPQTPGSVSVEHDPALAELQKSLEGAPTA